MNRLPELFRNPAIATTLRAAEWSDLLPRLITGRLIGHLDALLTLHDVDRSSLPPALLRQLAASNTVAGVRARSTRWECGEVSRALAGTGIPVMVVKGASYILADALPGRGRYVDDVDILVAAEALPEVELRLHAGGWVTDDADADSVGYYREWLHQIPPFVHAERLTLLDIHHTIIAPWGGHQVNVPELFRHAVPSGIDGILLPSPMDRCLIVSAHFVRSDAGSGSFRDLLDLYELLAVAAPDRASQQALAERARAIGLFRALATTSHFANVFFGSPVFGRRPLGVKMRAVATIPDGSTVAGRMTHYLRRAQQLSAFRAALPLRVMAKRTIERRLGLKKKVEEQKLKNRG